MKRIAFNREANKATLKRLTLPLTFSVEDHRQLSGYAAIWDALSGDRGGYLVSFAKDSMVLPTYPVVLLYNHNDDYLLASEENQSLTLAADAKGVSMQALLDRTFIDDYVAAKINSGVISGMSLGAYPIETHRVQRTISLEDAATNPELGSFVGQTVDIEVWTQWLLDELTVTGRPAFPQTQIEGYKKNKGETGEALEIVNRYEWEGRLLGLQLD